jgi:hypothetical protein
MVSHQTRCSTPCCSRFGNDWPPPTHTHKRGELKNWLLAVLYFGSSVLSPGLDSRAWGRRATRAGRRRSLRGSAPEDCSPTSEVKRPRLLPGLPDGIFSKPKIPIWVNFGGSFDGRCWYGRLVYFMAIWYILQPFGIFYAHLIIFVNLECFFSFLICCTKKNMATIRLPNLQLQRPYVS